LVPNLPRPIVDKTNMIFKATAAVSARPRQAPGTKGEEHLDVGFRRASNEPDVNLRAPCGQQVKASAIRAFSNTSLNGKPKPHGLRLGGTKGDIKVGICG